MFIYEVTDAFKKYRLDYAIVGGFGLALHGIVRATADVDVVLNLRLADFEKAEQVFESIGLRPRLPVRAAEVFTMRREYIENRNLIAWSFVDHRNPVRGVDVIITHDRKALDVKRVSVGGRRISVASLADLMRMKMKSGRPQDLVDVKRIKDKINGKV